VWPDEPLGSYADFTSTSELLFASFSDRVPVKNVSHENDLIFMRMNEQVTNISFYKKTLATEAKVNLELAVLSMSCHRGPLIPLDFTKAAMAITGRLEDNKPTMNTLRWALADKWKERCMDQMRC